MVQYIIGSSPYIVTANGQGARREQWEDGGGGGGGAGGGDGDGDGGFGGVQT